MSEQVAMNWEGRGRKRFCFALAFYFAIIRMERSYETRDISSRYSWCTRIEIRTSQKCYMTHISRKCFTSLCHHHHNHRIIKYLGESSLGRSRVRVLMRCIFFFSVYLILPAAVWPWGRLSLWEKWVPDIFLGVKSGQRVRLATLPTSMSFDVSQPYGPSRTVTGISFLRSEELYIFLWNPKHHYCVHNPTTYLFTEPDESNSHCVSFQSILKLSTLLRLGPRVITFGFSH
jgi:hypothetical protein